MDLNTFEFSYLGNLILSEHHLGMKMKVEAV